MPDVYKYLVESFNEPFSNSPAFSAIFTVNVDNEEQFTEWLKNFETKSNSQFNTYKTFVCDGQYVNFKKTYKCRHNVQGGVTGHRKHTSCNAKVSVTVRHCPKCTRNDCIKVHPAGLCL